MPYIVLDMSGHRSSCAYVHHRIHVLWNRGGPKEKARGGLARS